MNKHKNIDSDTFSAKRTKLDAIDPDIWKPLRTVKSNYFKKYITGTDVKNYLLNDPILDWFNIYHGKKNLPKISLTNDIRSESNNIDEFILFKNGNSFEKQIFDRLKELYTDSFILIATDTKNNFNENNYLKTIDEIKKGTPIIAQGVLFNNINGTGGIADLIVRSDYINKLTKYPTLFQDETNIKASNLNGKYHYRIIDIKWSTFNTCADGITIRNDGRTPSYKGQLAIYNVALGEIQGYFPDHAYILAKQWKFDNKDYPEPVFFNWNDRLGTIDYKNFDNKYIEKTKDAICWLNKLYSEGKQWDLYSPIVSEMYPNMANKNDSPWTELKYIISDKIDELTRIWYIGIQNRIYAHEKNILKWSDPKCNSQTLNVKGSTRPIIIDKILEINRSTTDVLLPKKITNNMLNWISTNNFDIYVDFETITGVLYNDVNINLESVNDETIFMIGIGHIVNNEWIYKVFTCIYLNLEEENRIITEFYNYIEKITNTINKDIIRIYHWHNAEISNMDRANLRHNNKWNIDANDYIWVDMCKVFTEEPIVVKGSFNFKLKDISNAMCKNNLINIKWPSTGPSNGFDAMCDAIKYYNNIKKYSESSNDILKSIENYNEIDCKSIWKIVSYLRENNC